MPEDCCCRLRKITLEEGRYVSHCYRVYKLNRQGKRNDKVAILGRADWVELFSNSRHKAYVDLYDRQARLSVEFAKKWGKVGGESGNNIGNQDIRNQASRCGLRVCWQQRRLMRR